jgi:hypothetical protein
MIFKLYLPSVRKKHSIKKTGSDEVFELVMNMGSSVTKVMCVPTYVRKFITRTGPCMRLKREPETPCKQRKE